MHVYHNNAYILELFKDISSSKVWSIVVMLQLKNENIVSIPDAESKLLRMESDTKQYLWK